jgi:hypothetical protein
VAVVVAVVQVWIVRMHVLQPGVPVSVRVRLGCLRAVRMLVVFVVFVPVFVFDRFVFMGVLVPLR